MKKLLTAMLLTAGVTAAQAQSSVTVYGSMDVGYIGSNTTLVATPNGAPAKTTVNQFGTAAEYSNRLGFKGNEDLGGGTSAFFTAEFQLFPQDQNLSGSSNNGLLNRQSFVGLKQDGIGAFSLGRQYTPLWRAYCQNSPTQCNNVVGDVIYMNASAGGAGTSTATTYTGTESGVGFTNRATNALYFASDKFKGFDVTAMYQLNNKNTTQTAAATGGEANQSGGGVGINYELGKFSAHGAYQQFTQFTTGTAMSWSDMVNTVIVSGKDSQAYLGADYDFGFLKAYASYVNRNITSTLNSSQFLKRDAKQVGVRGFFTPQIEGWASAGTGSFTGVGAAAPVNFNSYQLGSNYWLSKRTNLYAIFGSTETSGNQALVAGAGSSKNMYAMGVVHKF
jgi:predicted porin